MDQIEIDLKRYDGKVATLQETKFLEVMCIMWEEVWY